MWGYLAYAHNNQSSSSRKFHLHVQTIVKILLLQKRILYRRCKCVCTSSLRVMLACCPWRWSESVEPTSTRGNTSDSGNSRAHAFLITAPLSHTHQRARSGAQIRHVRLPCQDYGWHTIKEERSVYPIRKVIVIPRSGAFSRWPPFLLTYKSKMLWQHFSYLCSHPTLWRPEYGSYMIEGTPGQPYGGTMSEFNTVEGNMGKRRREASSVLNQNETLCTITSFPRCFALHWASVWTLVDNC